MNHPDDEVEAAYFLKKKMSLKYKKYKKMYQVVISICGLSSESWKLFFPIPEKIIRNKSQTI